MKTGNTTILVSFAVFTAVLSACETRGPTRDLIFVDGRAVAPVLDSMYGITAGSTPGLLLRHRRTGMLDTLGAESLSSPVHAQWMDGTWYVSDVVEGNALIVVFDSEGTEIDRTDLSGIASAPHQFAILPDRRIVVEGTDGRLLAIDGDSTTTFALTEVSDRPGLVVAARGGVLHSVASQTITLYNGQGNIRWRIEWPWDDTIYAVDLAVDSEGRTHLLAGQETQQTFLVFGFSQTTGEVIRWSREGTTSTFMVGRMGEIYPDSAANWLGN